MVKSVSMSVIRLTPSPDCNCEVYMTIITDAIKESCFGREERKADMYQRELDGYMECCGCMKNGGMGGLLSSSRWVTVVHLRGYYHCRAGIIVATNAGKQ